MPGANVAGIVTVTSNEHVAAAPGAAARLPPVSSKPCRSSPADTRATLEPAPHGGSGTGGSVTLTGKGRKPVPGPPSVSSSRKATSVAPLVVLVFVTVKRMTTSSPGWTTGSGRSVPSSRNSLVRIGAGLANKVSLAALPVTGDPATVPLTASVVFT